MGRFTAPDPLGDTGGDHNPYEYCLDDPVTMNDPSGLAPPLVLAILAGKALSAAIAGAGLYGAASLVGHGAEEAMNEVFPMAAGIQAATAAPGMIIAGAKAFAPLARTAGTALWSNAQRTAAPVAQRAGDMANAAWQRFGPAAIGASAAAASGSPTNALERAAHWGAEILKGDNIPLPPSGASPFEGIGGLLKIIKEEHKRK